MSWFVFSFISAILTSAAALVEKKALFKEHAMEFAAVLAFINGLIALPLFFFIDYSKIEPTALLILLGITVMGAFAFFLIMKALRHMEVTAVSPLRMLSPGIVSFLAFVLF